MGAVLPSVMSVAICLNLFFVARGRLCGAAAKSRVRVGVVANIKKRGN